MLDTKLKNSRKSGIFLVAVILCFCSLIMLSRYQELSSAVDSLKSPEIRYTEALSGIGDELMEGNYILYNEYSKTTPLSTVFEMYGQRDFDYTRKYLEYGIYDSDDQLLLSDEENQQNISLLNTDENRYAFRAVYSFDESNQLASIQVDGKSLEPEQEYNLESVYARAADELINYDMISSISQPGNVRIVYVMTESQLQDYADSQMPADTDMYRMAQSASYDETYTGLMVMIIAAALLLPLFRRFDVTGYRIFRMPFEVSVALVVLVVGVLYNFPVYIVYLTVSDDLLPGMGHGMELIAGLFNFLMWIVIFGTIFASVISMRAVLRMKGAYWSERTLTAGFLRRLKKGDGNYYEKIVKYTGRFYGKGKTFLKNQYDSLVHVDFQKKSTRTILKIVVFNYIILCLVCFLWWYGAFALLVYSVLLFLFLRKYTNDLQRKYSLLLHSTNLLADGRLEEPIEGDMGIFNPVRDELKKVQKGFKKAVDEEVKNERMKTELVTNVSHDLRTPLTAIITYTDLLKNEKDETKREEYINVLERKSLRLKVLIEDLFEMSKAASRSVEMHYVKADIVDLFKQVVLENNERIKDAELEVRWKLPDKKPVVYLDSQKTYRILENLVVNITKYAMPCTRVYLELKEEKDSIQIVMKNVSAAELNFDPDEITDRFVRGDLSRNTEGSGLGLAIAKSFIELQHGTLKISTDADLFKAEITLPKFEHLPENTEDVTEKTGAETSGSEKTGGKQNEI